MRKQIISFLFLFNCACLKIQAQINYVLNPSFEQYSQCPWQWDQIRLANYWSQIDTVDTDPVCSPEYCNVCAGANAMTGIPLNGGFYHYPRTGNGMVSMQMYFDESYSPEVYQRDYTQGRFYKPLIAGKYYCVTFYVAFEQTSAYAINHIGAYLDDGIIDVGQDSIGCAAPQTAYTPQIVENAIIADTNWTMIQGLIIATGTERFITIGNFYDIKHTDTIPKIISDAFSWYLIDDVSVVETGTKPNAGPDAYVSPGSDSATIGSSEEGLPLTWFVYGSLVPIGHTGSLKVHPDTTTTYVLSMDLCDGGTTDTVTVWVAPTKVGNVKMSQCENVKIYPNPTTGNFSIEHAKGLQLTIYDVLGKEVFATVLNSDKEQVNINDLPGGVYMGQITDAKTGVRVVRKIVKE